MLRLFWSFWGQAQILILGRKIAFLGSISWFFGDLGTHLFHRFRLKRNDHIWPKWPIFGLFDPLLAISDTSRGSSHIYNLYYRVYRYIIMMDFGPQIRFFGSLDDFWHYLYPYITYIIGYICTLCSIPWIYVYTIFSYISHILVIFTLYPINHCCI